MNLLSQTLRIKVGALALLLVLPGCQSASRPPQTVSDDTRARLAQALLAAGDRDSAAEALRTPQSREAEDAKTALTNADVLISAGQVDRGMKVAKAALAGHKDDPEFAFEVASLAVKANQLSDAADIYRTVWRAHPDNIAALNGQGVVSAQQGDLAAAENSLRSALSLSPQDVHTRSNLALVLLLKGQSAAALPLLEELNRSNPSPQVAAALGTARERLGAAAQANASTSGGAISIGPTAMASVVPAK